MPKPQGPFGKRNLIGVSLPALRKKAALSQRGLAQQLQISGLDIDKNVITRIETQKRYVTDIEIKAIAKMFGVSYSYLIDGEPD